MLTALTLNTLILTVVTLVVVVVNAHTYRPVP